MFRASINEIVNENDEFIVENIICERSVNLIVGSPKMGKTMLGLNLAISINEGYEFLNNRVVKRKVVYYCNELPFNVIQKRVNQLDLKCSDDLVIYSHIEPIDFIKLEQIVAEETKLGYTVFFIDTLSKINIHQNYDFNNYKDTYSLISNFYKLIEKYGCTFIMMYHTKKTADMKNISQSVMGSQGLSGAVDTVILIDKKSELDKEFKIHITSRLFESNSYQVKNDHRTKKIVLNDIEPIDLLEPSIQKLVQIMPRKKLLEGTIVDICSEINLDIESPQQFGKTLVKNKDILLKNGITLIYKRTSSHKIYTISYDQSKVKY